jgi:hypothetical protein
MDDWLVAAAVVSCAAQGAGFAHAMNHEQHGWAVVFLVLCAVTGAALTLLNPAVVEGAGCDGHW